MGHIVACESIQPQQQVRHVLTAKSENTFVRQSNFFFQSFAELLNCRLFVHLVPLCTWLCVIALCDCPLMPCVLCVLSLPLLVAKLTFQSFFSFVFNAVVSIVFTLKSPLCLGYSCVLRVCFCFVFMSLSAFVFKENLLESN